MAATPEHANASLMEAFRVWPVRRGTYVSQDFGADQYRRLRRPPGRPWFHAGVDRDVGTTPTRLRGRGHVRRASLVCRTFPGAQNLAPIWAG